MYQTIVKPKRSCTKYITRVVDGIFCVFSVFKIILYSVNIFLLRYIFEKTLLSYFKILPKTSYVIIMNRKGKKNHEGERVDESHEDVNIRKRKVYIDWTTKKQRGIWHM